MTKTESQILPKLEDDSTSSLKVPSALVGQLLICEMSNRYTVYRQPLPVGSILTLVIGILELWKFSEERQVWGSYFGK